MPDGGGLRVGGEIMGTLLLSMLCTLCDLLDEGGGGPGGGGGSGIPGSHLVWEVDRERADVGVSMAPVEAALRDAGGKASGLMTDTTRSCSSVWNMEGPTLRLVAGIGGIGSGELADSWSRRLPKDASAKRRSRELPLPLTPGGGGNERVAAAGGSGDGR